MTSRWKCDSCGGASQWDYCEAASFAQGYHAALVAMEVQS
jgi:hypothetical protein